MSALDLDNLMPRSWVLESAGGSWEWLPVVAGTPNPTNASSMRLPEGGGWSIMVSSALTVDAQLRLYDGEGNIVVALIPAALGDGRMATVVAQTPVKKSGAIHVQARGTPVVGQRVLVSATSIPLSSY